ncbi:putative pre-mRNA splicing protein [Cercophora scortea]|uniref:Pre-mRNA-splicing factor SYF2 n=1 Tax=Cercophora scortea TaxID=314031 RepID=A0AAE0IZC9_9PEZI|nr:putative pre-mRNA splicing protein [Cercophora scortea]
MPPAKKRKTRASAKAEAAAEAVKQESTSEARAPSPEQAMTAADTAEPSLASASLPTPAPPPEPKQATPEAEPESKQAATTTTTTTRSAPAPAPAAAPEPASTSTSTPTPAPTAAEVAAKAEERMARFRALQARAKTSSTQNLKEATRETQRMSADPGQLTAVTRKHAVASHKLLKADVEDSGGDFERKRAWDWTVDESERWDKKMKKAAAARDNTTFRDYNQESEKAYKRQLRGMGAPDLERYTRDKLAAIEKAAAAGTLEIVETEDGEMIAVDKEGTFFSTADSTAFAQHRPDKAAVDRLVGNLRKAEDASLKKRRERMAANNGEDGDVTYINEKNKQFNQKLERFYNKYTTEIRNSFERGTMI